MPSTRSAAQRPYARLFADTPTGLPREQAMLRLVDLFWDALHPTGVSWVGFYVKATPADELILAARRDKPACSPIGLHGACGRSFTSRRSLVVTDVANLGTGYIACDPRDRSEVVVPMFEPTDDAKAAGGPAWGVLDLDSYDTNAFTPDDAAALFDILVQAGLSSSHPTLEADVV